jgi:hypothetical protein
MLGKSMRKLQAAWERERVVDNRRTGGRPMPTLKNCSDAQRTTNAAEVAVMREKERWRTANDLTPDELAAIAADTELHRKRRRGEGEGESESEDEEAPAKRTKSASALLAASTGLSRKRKRGGRDVDADADAESDGEASAKRTKSVSALLAVDKSKLQDEINERIARRKRLSMQSFGPRAPGGAAAAVNIPATGQDRPAHVVNAPIQDLLDAVTAHPGGDGSSRGARTRSRYATNTASTSAHVQSVMFQHLLGSLPRMHEDVVNSRVAKTRTLADCYRDLDRMILMLDQFRNPQKPGTLLVRAKYQRKFHRMMICTMLPGIFRDLFVPHMAEILKRYGYTHYRGEALITTPRQCGKTTSECLLLAAAIICIPGYRAAVFAQGQLNSNNIIEETYNFICTIPGAKEMVTMHNKSEIQINSQGLCDKRKIRAYASTPDSARGFSAWHLILDEIASMNRKLLYETIFPVAVKEESGLVGVSTVTNEDNVLTELIQVEDESSPDGKLFYVDSIMDVCDECRAGPDPGGCTHVTQLIAPWKLLTKMNKFEAAMGANREISDRENKGLIGMVNKRAYMVAHLEQFRARVVNLADLPGGGKPAVVYISADPSGGGQSQAAFVARIYLEDGDIRSIVVGVGVSNTLVARKDRLNFMDKFYTALREHPLCDRCTFVNMFEGNMQTAASNMADYVVTDAINFVMSEVRVVSQVGHATKRAANDNCSFTPGVLKTKINTDEAQETTEAELYAGSCAFSRDMVAIVASDAANKGIEDNTDAARRHNRNLLIHQLGNVRIDAKTGLISGKHDGTMQDDVAVAYTQTGPYRKIFWERKDRPEQSRVQRSIRERGRNY